MKEINDVHCQGNDCGLCPECDPEGNDVALLDGESYLRLRFSNMDSVAWTKMEETFAADGFKATRDIRDGLDAVTVTGPKTAMDKLTAEMTMALRIAK